MNRHKFFQSLLISGLLIATSQNAIGGGYHHHRHHHYDDGGELAAALVIGGLFGYLIADSHYHHYRGYGYRTYYTGYPASAAVVYRRVERIPVVVKPEQTSEFAGSDCLMTREYTTTLTVDGVDREAYGTRCMTADGGWILGQPKLMPEY